MFGHICHCDASITGSSKESLENAVVSHNKSHERLPPERKMDLSGIIQLLIGIERRLEHIERRLRKLEQAVFHHAAKSARLLFFVNLNSKGGTMDTTVHITDAPLTASLVEFDGPNGTGNKVVPIGPTTYSSSDLSIATVDANTGKLTYVKEGQATITALDSGNRLTASAILTIISGLAQSATLEFNV